MDAPTPEQYQPAISRRGHALRYAGMVAIGLFVWTWVIEGQWNGQRGLFWLDLGLGLLGFVVVAYRRRYPWAVAVLLNAMGIGSALVTGPSILATVSLASRRRRTEVLSVGAVVVVCATTFYLIQPVSTDDGLAIQLVVNVVVAAMQIGWGLYIGSRRELEWALRHRLERAEAERDLLLRQARISERTRIAREMHDVLAHRISQVSMYAGALAFRDDLEPSQVRSTAGVIRDTAHKALTDLRSVLGVLRDTSTGEVRDRPQPTFEDLSLLVEEAQASGVDIEYSATVPPDQVVPDRVGRTVYRVVQEGITNASRHAPGSTLTVRVTARPETGVDFELSNPVTTNGATVPTSGLGLVGLAERTELAGGRLAHGTDRDRFWLRGWIPWGA